MQLIQGDWEGAWETILGIFERIGDAVLSIGDAIWEGLIKIFTDIVEGVKEKAQELVDGVKDILGIHSLSRVFVDIGENMMQALGAGVKGGLDVPVRALADAGSLMTAAAVPVPARTGGVSVSGSAAGFQGGQNVQIYGLSLYGVQNAQGLLAELQELGL